jgi:hypothetical protein
VDEIALNPCMNFGALATELMLAVGVQDADGSVREQIFQAVQRDVLDAAHPEGTATLAFNTRAGTLHCLVGAGVVTPIQFEPS